MFRHRILFGPLMIAGIVLLFWLDNRLDRLDISSTFLQDLFQGRTYLPAGLLMLTLFLILIPIASTELCVMFRAKGIGVDTVMIAFAGMMGCLLTYVIPFRIESQLATAIISTLLVLVFVVSLAQHSWPARKTEGALAVAAATMFTVIYLGLLPGFFVSIRRWHSAWVVLAVILVAKSCDIGAYLTGRAIGRHRLIPWLSPGKTWEGLMGGLVLSGLVAVLLALMGSTYESIGRWDLADGERVFVPYHCPLWFAALGGALIGLVGQFGDLIASLFKRDAGLKDSGGLVPGFGGVIDVIDSAIVVAPVAYWLLMIMALFG